VTSASSLSLGTLEIELAHLALDYTHLRARDVRAEALLTASIEREGQQHPVLVVQRTDGHVLIDGYRRVRALKHLRRDTVVVLVTGSSEADALVYSHRLTTGRRQSALEEGWLVHELREHAGRSLDQIATLLGRSKSWVSRRLGLACALPESVAEVARRGALPAHGVMRSLVPLARANGKHAEQIVATLASSRPTTRQLAALWSAYRRSDTEQRARIASEPALLIRTLESRSPPPTVLAIAHRLDVAAIALDRARTSLLTAREHGAILSPSQGVLGRAWIRTTQAHTALAQEVERDA
jgi:ParB/RepB/Spo0J family partition protein